MLGKTFLLGMLISLVMIMAAVPCLACEQCTRDVPVMSTALDIDTDYQPVMATNETNMPSPGVASERGTSHVVTFNHLNGSGLVGQGGELLRQVGRPKSILS
jgi:hypothetical protein